MNHQTKSVLPWLILVIIGAIIQLVITINYPESEISLIGGIMVVIGGILVAIRITLVSKRKEIRHENR